MFVTLPFVLTAALLAPAGPLGLAHGEPVESAQPQQTPNFDQTVNVARGARLTVSNQAGEVVMRTWDRDAVRVMARHASRARPSVRSGETVVTVTGSGMGAIDFDITVPSWMPVKVTGHYNYVELNGMGADVTVENVRGDIDIKGGRGFVTATSIEGKITITGTQGKVTAKAVNDDIAVENATGEISVDATNGHITLTNVRTDVAEVSALNGNIRYTGTLADKGRYTFVTHNGSVFLTIQPNPNATFYVRTYEGRFTQAVNLKPQGEQRRGRRNTYIGGTGSAQVEIESFNGRVSVTAKQ